MEAGSPRVRLCQRRASRSVDVIWRPVNMTPSGRGQAISIVQGTQEMGGLAGRIVLAARALVIVSRRRAWQSARDLARARRRPNTARGGRRARPAMACHQKFTLFLLSPGPPAVTIKKAMVIDGIYYALAFSAGGALVWYLLDPAFAAPLFLLALFCLYFFRDPERAIPDGPVAVSPADGKVVGIMGDGAECTRISIFLNVFDVHVNRAPIAGKVTAVEYTKGQFLVASREIASSQNERNT